MRYEDVKEDFELVKQTLEWFTTKYKGKWSYSRGFGITDNKVWPMYPTYLKAELGLDFDE